jgi:hypothetical protein
MRLRLLLLAVLAFYAVLPDTVNADPRKKPQARTSLDYTWELLPKTEGINATTDINRHGAWAGWRYDSKTDIAYGISVDKRGVTKEFVCAAALERDRSAHSNAINNKGDILGDCGDGSLFIRTPNGAINQFRPACPDFALCLKFGQVSVSPFDFNDHRQAVGEYFNPPMPGDQSGFARLKGFIMTADGVFTVLEGPSFPDHTGYPHTVKRTMPVAINNRGQVIVNSGTIRTPSNEAGMGGNFLYDNGQFTPLPVGALVDINNEGQVLMYIGEMVAGIYDDGKFYPINSPAGYLLADVSALTDDGRVLATLHSTAPSKFPVLHRAIGTPVK